MNALLDFLTVSTVVFMAAAAVIAIGGVFMSITADRLADRSGEVLGSGDSILCSDRHMLQHTTGHSWHLRVFLS